MQKNNTDIIIYQTEDGKTKIEVSVLDETVWLTQAQLVDLFQSSKSNNERELNNKEAIWALFPALNRMSKRGFSTEEILEKLREKGIDVKAQTYRKYMAERRKVELQKAQANATKPKKAKKAKPVVDEEMEHNDMVEVGLANTTMPTGAQSLKINSAITAPKLTDLCVRLLDVYQKEDYKHNFPNIHYIIPVNDPELVSKLNQLLIVAFNQKPEPVDLVLTTPDILDYSDHFNFKYSGAGRDPVIYDDVFLFHYREYLEKRKVSEISIEIFNKHQLMICDEDGNKKNSFSIFKCFLFDCDFEGEHFHLCDGQWYQVENDYLKQLKTELDPTFTDLALLTECNTKREDDYNKEIAQNGNSEVVCLDKSNIAPKGQRQIEPCDLYTIINGRAYMIHIKISTRSSSLSHLFNQGLNSVKMIRLNNESKEKLKLLLPDKNQHIPIDKEQFTVIFGIITKKPKDKKSDGLPLFSRISLSRVIRSLQLMGVVANVVYIEDKVDRKNLGDING